MKKYIAFLITVATVSACASTSSSYDISEEEAAYRRAKAQSIDNEDYAIARKRRQDSIEDYGTMRMKEAEAIKKATENTSKQPIILY